jgi:hypothetical protein
VAAVSILAAVASIVAAAFSAAAARRSSMVHESNLLLSVMKTLQEDDVRAARKYVFDNLETRPFADWSGPDREQADIVIRTYDMAAKLSQDSKRVRELLVQDWGEQATRQLKIVKPLIEEQRVRRRMKGLWHDFLKLVEESEEFERDHSTGKN